MCHFFSAILDETGNVLFDLETDNHERLIQKFNLKPSEDSYKWIRVEITPRQNILTKPEEEHWNIRIDEPTSPEWYERNTVLYKANLFEALEKRQNHIWNEMRNHFCNKNIEQLLEYLDNKIFFAMLEEHLTSFKDEIETDALENQEPDNDGWDEGFDEGKNEGRAEALEEAIDAIKGL